MRLIVFPAPVSNSNGYSIAVESDFKRLNVNYPNDKVIWYISANHESTVDQGEIITRFGRFSWKRVLNLLQGRVSCELRSIDLDFLNNKEEPDYIFCGDVIAYRALRKVFPNKELIVRFHNCFKRIEDRISIIGERSLSFAYKLDMKTISLLEKEIFTDDNTYKIFISNEDMDYYRLLTGRTGDSEVWPILPNSTLSLKNRTTNHQFKKLVYFGGLDIHKVDSVKWFINVVFSEIRKNNSKLEFHLFGNGTELLDEKNRGIYGHGRYLGDDFPFQNDSLYVNPDLTGGGVKIKVKSYLENDIVSLSTPFGFEGYSSELIDNYYCYVKSPEEWVGFISSLFENYQ